MLLKGFDVVGVLFCWGCWVESLLRGLDGGSRGFAYGRIGHHHHTTLKQAA